MALVNKINKSAKVDKNTVNKYQIITHCFFNNIDVNKSDVEVLSTIADKKISLPDLCKLLYKNKVFKSEQSARTALGKIEKKGLIIKHKGEDVKFVSINPDIGILEGNVLLDFKFLGIES